jgi:hypothetical protein
MANDDSQSRRIDCSPKRVAWQNFEEEVPAYIEKSIINGKWGLVPHLAKVRRKPSYYSKAREKEIVFDASVEVVTEFDLDSPVLIWILECKDYPERNVSVDEVEEFHSKLVQVGAHKGTIFTRKGFDAGGITFARTHRIGLCTLFKQRHTIMQFSSSGGIFEVEDIESEFFLDHENIFREHPTLRLIVRNELKEFNLKIAATPLHERVNWGGELE